MYLSTFRKHGVGLGNWGSAVWRDCGLDLDLLLNKADATLNSWKEAHDVFNTWQQNQPKVDTFAFREMRGLVHQVIRDDICNTPTSYPNEAITYALLERWIAVRQAGLKAGEVSP